MTTAEQPITRSELREELNALRTEFREHYATKADLAEMKVELIKWMIGLMVGATTLAASIAVLVQRIIG